MNIIKQEDFSSLKKHMTEANAILFAIIQQKSKEKQIEKYKSDSDSGNIYYNYFVVVNTLKVCSKQITYIQEIDVYDLDELLIVQNSLEISIKSLESQKIFSKEIQHLNIILDSIKYDRKDQLKDTLKQFNKTQNSKIELNPDKMQQSLIFFQNTTKPNQCEPMRSSIQKDRFETQFRELFLELDHKKQIVNPLMFVINRNIEAENPEVLFYVLSDQMRRANRAFFKSLKYDEKLMFSFHGQFTADSKDSLAYSLTLQETSTLSYKNIASNKISREEFINKTKKCLQSQFKVQEHQIQMIALEQGSIKLIFEIIDFAGEVHYSENIKELQDLFPGSQPQIKVHDYFKTAALSINDFAPNYNMVWDDFVFGNYDDRGPKGMTEPYFYPIGWKGYALNVAGRYGDNDNWLKMDNNKQEWYVMFHGTSFDGFKGIMNDQRKFKTGKAQGYENDICMITKKKIGKGVYFSNHIEVCQMYSEPTHIQNQQFILAFQSRVRPEALRKCEKRSDLAGNLEEYKRRNKYVVDSLKNTSLWDNDYFVINNTADIRPYRILLKKVQ